MKRFLLTLLTLLTLSVGGVGIDAIITHMMTDLWITFDMALLGYAIMALSSIAFCVWRYLVEWRWLDP